MRNRSPSLALVVPWSGTGKAHAFVTAHSSDAVALVALTPENEVVFFEQDRLGTRKNSLEKLGKVVRT
jgi:hypothetical protein